MQPDARTLAELLSVAGLIGGTIEYVEIVKRRAFMRRLAASREENADLGLHGLVRVLLADEAQDSTPSKAVIRPTPR
jgi:hypothetical protein